MSNLLQSNGHLPVMSASPTAFTLSQSSAESSPPRILRSRSLISRLSAQSAQSVAPYIAPFTRESKIVGLLRIKLALLIITIAILAAIYWHQTFYFAKAVLDWIGHHPYAGCVIFILLFTVMTTVLIPPSIITIGCGFVYYHEFGIPGVIISTIIVWIGCSLGAIASFFMSRYLFRACVLRFAQSNTKFRIIEGMVRNHGLKVAVVIRLSPVLPFVMTNYVFGVTSIKPVHYMLGLTVIVPGCVFYVIVGSTISQLSDISNADSSVSKSPQGLAFLIVGAIITIVAAIVFTIAARRQFREIENEINSTSLNVDSEIELAEMQIDE